jgi:hypothetical protein
LLKEKLKLSAFTGPVAIETKNADTIGTMNRSSALISGHAARRSTPIFDARQIPPPRI